MSEVSIVQRIIELDCQKGQSFWVVLPLVSADHAVPGRGARLMSWSGRFGGRHSRSGNDMRMVWVLLPRFMFGEFCAGRPSLVVATKRGCFRRQDER